MKRINILLPGMVLLLLLSGCTGRTHDLLTETGSESSDLFAGTDSENRDAQKDVESEKDGEKTNSSDKIQESEIDMEESETIFVYVCGCVVNPAVYEVNVDARVYEAIELAGGFSEEAAEAALNLAENMVDGQKIYVPSTKEQISSGGQEAAEGLPSAEQPNAKESGLVNLNTATKDQLMTLKGIGEAKADSILSYREDHGAFSAIEDIMKIEGIKEGVFNKIKDDITV